MEGGLQKEGKAEEPQSSAFTLSFGCIARMKKHGNRKDIRLPCRVFFACQKLFHQSCKPCDHAVREEHEHEETEDVGGQEEHAAFEDLRRAGVFADARDDEAGNADRRCHRAKRRDKADDLSEPHGIVSKMRDKWLEERKRDHQKGQ